MKQLLFLFLLGISIIPLFNCCTEEGTNSLNASEIYALNSCQLSCIQDYERSESLERDLITNTIPQINDLFNIATTIHARTEKLDSLTLIVVHQINRLKIKAIERNTGESITFKSPVIVGQSFYSQSPLIVDLNQIQLIQDSQNPSILPTEIQSLKKNIEQLRIYHLEQLLDYFDLKSLENTYKKKPGDFHNFSKQYSIIEQSKRKANRYLCGAGSKYRIEQINGCLSYNDYQWEGMFSANTSLPIILTNLTSLQADLFKTRIKVFELFEVHMHCQKLMLKDQKKKLR